MAHPLRAGVASGTLNIRMTDAEKAHVRRAAAVAGVPVGEYIRRCIPGLADVPHAGPAVTPTIQPEEAVATT